MLARLTYVHAGCDLTIDVSGSCVTSTSANATGSVGFTLGQVSCACEEDISFKVIDGCCSNKVPAHAMIRACDEECTRSAISSARESRADGLVTPPYAFLAPIAAVSARSRAPAQSVIREPPAPPHSFGFSSSVNFSRTFSTFGIATART